MDYTSKRNTGFTLLCIGYENLFDFVNGHCLLIFILFLNMSVLKDHTSLHTFILHTEHGV